MDTVEVEDSQYDTAYLDTLTNCQSAMWSARFAMGIHTLNFKLDTGVEVTAISEGAFQRLRDVELRKPSKKLLGPNMTPLKVRGQFTHPHLQR